MNLEIITNHQPRPIVYGYELSEKEKKDFDYLESDDLEYNAFFKYKGQVYDLGEFMRINDNEDLEGWDGYSGDSYFSGTLVKLIDEENVIVGRYYS